MISLLSRWFVRDRANTADPAVRKAYGVLCGAVGIGLNVLLFLGKFLQLDRVCSIFRESHGFFQFFLQGFQSGNFFLTFL